MTMLCATNVYAKTYMGKITLEIGDTYLASAVPTSGYTASGSFSKSGTCFAITANGSYYCTIKANYAGKGTLSYWGSVAPANSWTTDIYDMYWDVEVKAAPVKVTSISLSSSSISLVEGEAMQLTATVLPSSATNKTVTWSSSASDVVTVNADGMLTAKAKGTATVTCSASDGSGVTATCEVTVADKIPVTNITLSDTSLGLDKAYSRTIYATLMPANNTCTSVKWTSSNTDVATVFGYTNKEADGRFKAIINPKTLGTTTITCIADDGSGMQAECTVNVYEHGDNSYFSAKTTEGVEIHYHVIEAASGTCEVVYDYNYRNVSGTVTIPNEVDGFTVSNIRGAAFSNCPNITKVNLPSSIEELGTGAFYGCTSLASIALDNVKRLGGQAFLYCPSLSKVTGINNLEYIGRYAFSGTPWYDKLPDGLLYLGKVFYKYKGTMPANTEIAVKEGIVSISPDAIEQWGLTSISLPKSLANLDYSSIQSGHLKRITVDAENETYDSRENCNAIIEKNSNTLIVGCQTSTIPNSVDSIADEAFNGRGLTAIKIGSGVSKIGIEAFRGTNLRSITVAEDNPYFDSRDSCNAIIETVTNRLVVGCATTAIPHSIKSIGSYAFSYASGLESVGVHDEVETIEDHAFASLNSLKSVSVGRGLKDIGEQAFYGCNNLISVHSLMETPINIDKKVFESDYYQKEDSIYNKAKLYVPKGTLITYMTTEGWANFKNIIEIDDDALVEGEIFTDETTEGVELKYQVTDAIVKTCELIASPDSINGIVTIPEQPKGYIVVGIGKQVFFNPSDKNRQITYVSIPATVKSIGNSAFAYCRELVEINLPEELESIGMSAFSQCEKLEQVNLPSKMKFIDRWAFYRCSAIEKLVIPASVDSIGQTAFYSCNSLKTIQCLWPKPIKINTDVFESGISNAPDTIYYNAKLYVPVGRKATYQQADVWKKFINIRVFTGMT